MSYNIELRQLAATEIIEAFEWYESKKQGLGIDFLEELELFNEILLQNPFAFSYYKDPVRQGRLDRFPYLVVFEIVYSTIVIYSVFMEKRNPENKPSN